MSIIDQSKKYWISYIRRYDSQKFIDKTFEEIEFLNDKISQYHIEEREYLDRIKYLEKKLDIEKNKGIYGENPKVMTLFIKVITLEDKSNDCLFLYLKGGEKNARQGYEHNSWSIILCSHVYFRSCTLLCKKRYGAF